MWMFFLLYCSKSAITISVSLSGGFFVMCSELDCFYNSAERSDFKNNSSLWFVAAGQLFLL